MSLKTQHKRKASDESHPLDGVLKKRLKLFSGGLFNHRKDANDEDDDAKPSFIEISDIQQESTGINQSYEAPCQSILDADRSQVSSNDSFSVSMAD